jgi:hypothetical protein
LPEDDQYINFERKSDLKSMQNYYEKYNLSLHNVKEFERGINDVVTSLDTDIRTNITWAKEAMQQTAEKTKKPEYKVSVTDPWAKIAKEYEDIIRLHIRASAFKTWVIRFLVISNDKFAEFTEHAVADMTELKKIEATRDIFKTMLEQQGAGQGDTLKKMQELQALIGEQSGMMSEMKDQMILYKERAEALKIALDQKPKVIEKYIDRPVITMPAQSAAVTVPIPTTNEYPSTVEEYKKLAENIRASTLQSEENPEPVEITDSPDEDEEEDEELSADEDDTEEMDSDDEEDQGQIMPVESITEQPLIKSDTKKVRISYPTFEEELAVYKEFIEANKFENSNGEILPLLDSAEEIKTTLDIDASTYSSKEQKKRFLYELAGTYSDFSYTLEAVAEFLGISEKQLKKTLDNMSLTDKINWVK